MAYKVIILYRLYMPSYLLGTFTEYPYVIRKLPVKYVLQNTKKYSRLGTIRLDLPPSRD